MRAYIRAVHAFAAQCALTSLCCAQGSCATGCLRAVAGYSLSGNDTLRSEFYAIFYNGPWTPDDISKPWKVWSSEIPNKPGEFAQVKSVDYLQNAMSLMEAQANGADHGIFLNSDGTICEGNTYNVGLITHDGVLKTPPFESCLAGCTLSRIIKLLEQRMGEWRLDRPHQPPLSGCAAVCRRLAHAVRRTTCTLRVRARHTGSASARVCAS